MKPQKPKPAWQSRIVGRATVDAKKLKPHPLNFRLHPEAQKKAMAAILDKVGWIEDVIVNKTTGYILNGHLRVEMAAAKDEKIPVCYVNLTEAEERLILASHDPIGELAIIDDELLASLLSEVTIDDAGLRAMLEGLLDESVAGTPHAQKDLSPAPSDRAPRNMGDRKAQIKPVLYAAQVAEFEKALQLTGEMNRGKALLMICDFFVQGNAK